MTVELKPCPFCGSEVELEKIPLWYGNDRGYKDCYKFEIRCKKCGCRVDQPENDSIYRNEEKAKKNAIKAWNRRDKAIHSPSQIPETSDLISRQAVINKINERQRKLIYCFGFENDAVKIMDIAKSIIIDIPPVQPEIIRCKDCKFWRTSTYINGKFKFLPKCGFNQIYVDGEDFCSRAERREK